MEEIIYRSRVPGGKDAHVRLDPLFLDDYSYDSAQSDDVTFSGLASVRWGTIGGEALFPFLRGGIIIIGRKGAEGAKGGGG